MIFGIIALVFGVLAMVISFVPCVGFLAFIPAFVGLVCGIIGLIIAIVKKASKGLSIAGIVLSVLAAIWVPLTVVFLMGGSLGALGLTSMAASEANERLTQSSSSRSSTFTPASGSRTHGASRQSSGTSPGSTSSSGAGSSGTSPSSVPVPPDPQPTPTEPAVSDEARQLESDIQQFGQRLGELSQSGIWRRVKEFRDEVDQLGTGAERDPLHEQLDVLTLGVLDSRAYPYYERAAQYLQDDKLSFAEREWQKANDVYTGAEVPRLRSPRAGSALYAAIQELGTAIQMSRDPGKRYSLKAVAETGAMLRDNITGESETVKEGERIGGYILSDVDMKEFEVTLTDPEGRRHVLRRQGR